MRLLLPLLLAALPAFGQFGTGRDGPLVVTGRVITERGGLLVADASAGATEVFVQALRVAPGDLVLLSRASGEPAADQGAWFTVRIHELRGSVLTLAEPLPHATRAGTQVVRVLEPSTVMVADAGQLLAPAFDGVTGGILALFTPGDFWNEGLVSASGAGFPGGQRRLTPRTLGCQPDAGAAEAGRGPGSGGAGGPCFQAGGGGGGNVGSGGSGGASRDGARPGGAAGAGSSRVDGAALRFGGGGGAGWTDAIDLGLSGVGGAGGGLLLLRATRVLGSGSFEANGAFAPGYGGTDFGLGGGGAGGAISIATRTSLACGLVRANGGAGGGGNNFVGGSGGGGGGGLVVLQAGRGASCPAQALAGLGGHPSGRPG